MTNYIKSEMYRVSKSKAIYGTIMICTCLMLAMNLVLWYFRMETEAFPYGTTKFSFSMLITGMQAALCLAATMTSFAFGDEYKNRTLNNAIAFGVSPAKIFLGKWLVTLFVCLIGLVVVEGALVGSGYLLLEDSGVTHLNGLLRANIACIPMFIAGVTGHLAFLFLLKNENSAIWAWVGTFLVGNMIASLLGLKIRFFKWLADWMVYGLAGSYTIDGETGAMTMLWDTAKGMQRAILAGVLGTVVFMVIGIIGAKKRK